MDWAGALGIFLAAIVARLVIEAWSRAVTDADHEAARVRSDEAFQEAVRLGVITEHGTAKTAPSRRPDIFRDPFGNPITRPKGPMPKAGVTSKDERIRELEDEVSTLRSRLAEKGGMR